MTKQINNKPVIMEIDNVAIVRDNSQNLAVYRLEEVYNPFEKEYASKYQFKGFHSTVLACLKAIKYKELLVNENDCKTLDRYVKQIVRADKMILRALEVNKNESK